MKRRPDSETAALLARARTGDWLSEQEKDQLLDYNHNFVFRLYVKGCNSSGHLPKELLTTVQEPEGHHPWRMLGRSEPVAGVSDAFMLTVWHDHEGRGFYWGVCLDGDSLQEGYAPTIEEAARQGGDAFALENFKREPVDPPDYAAREKALKKGEAPPCDICGTLANSYCTECQHTFCETEGTCPKQPLATRSSCIFCGKNDRRLLTKPDCSTPIDIEIQGEHFVSKLPDGRFVRSKRKRDVVRRLRELGFFVADVVSGAR